mmetsp:Transcript_4139/g.10582  ORF Transcript_4139/g.10582 Transcript_4139/m.10582 type:complete len:423 (-) Transcript_4139:57-1325(-)
MLAHFLSEHLEQDPDVGNAHDKAHQEREEGAGLERVFVPRGGEDKGNQHEDIRENHHHGNAQSDPLLCPPDHHGAHDLLAANEFDQGDEGKGQLEAQHDRAEDDQFLRAFLSRDHGDQEAGDDGHHPRDERAQRRLELEVHKAFHHILARQRARHRAREPRGEQGAPEEGLGRVSQDIFQHVGRILQRLVDQFLLLILRHPLHSRVGHHRHGHVDEERYSQRQGRLEPAVEHSELRLRQTHWQARPSLRAFLVLAPFQSIPAAAAAIAAAAVGPVVLQELDALRVLVSARVRFLVSRENQGRVQEEVVGHHQRPQHAHGDVGTLVHGRLEPADREEPSEDVPDGDVLADVAELGHEAKADDGDQEGEEDLQHARAELLQEQKDHRTGARDENARHHGNPEEHFQREGRPDHLRNVARDDGQL